MKILTNNKLKNFSLWRFDRKNYPGLNLKVEKSSIHEFIEMFQKILFEEFSIKILLKNNIPSTKTLEFINANSEFSYKENVIFIIKNSINENTLYITETFSDYEITLSKQKLIELIESLEKVKVGDMDFAISDENNSENILYFW